MDLASANFPEGPSNQASNDELVERRWVNSLGGGDQAMGKTHAPGQGCRFAVVTVAGEQAADASDSVAERGGRGAGIQHLKERNVSAARDPDKGGYPGDQTAEPGKSVLADEFAGMSE